VVELVSGLVFVLGGEEVGDEVGGFAFGWVYQIRGAVR
jgi:hypothetical protein